MLNECVTKNGILKKAQTYATSASQANDKCLVHFSRYFAGNYWILDLEEDYSWVIVGEPCRKFAWIMSRQENVDRSSAKLLEKVQHLKENGYDTRGLIFRGDTDIEAKSI